MKDVQKLGGMGALLQAAFFAALLILDLLVLPGPGTLNNPAKALPFAANSPLLTILSLIYVPLFFGIILVSLALYDRLQVGSPGLVRFATVAGLISAVLFLARAMIGFTALAQLTQLYPNNPTGAGAAYIALRFIVSGLNVAAVFAVGWAILLASWAALRTGRLSRPLSSLGLLAGTVGILSSVIPYGGLIGAAITLVWALWLAAVLLLPQPIKHQTPVPARA
jgi:hypothetical protein